ncbi:MAG: TonB-linked SusC/RagA family outer membrane protein, partial [Limisphaerales bacterium]
KELHSFTVLLGTSAISWKNEYHGSAKSNLPSNDPDDVFLDNFIDVGSERAWNGASEFSFLSYFGRVNYEYDNKYLFAATMRVDGSSRFGENNRFGYFPSASAGWVISREDFFSENSAISFLKLRASWGQNGNAEIGNYGYTTTIFTGQNYTLGPNETIVNGSGPVSTSNPDLKWETNAQTNVGIDLELLDGMFNFTTDFYMKNTSDMLAVIPIPTIVGLEPSVTNVGDVSNKGIEIEAEYRKRTGKLTFDIGGNISFVKNEVTNLGVGGDAINSGNVQSASSTVALTDVGSPIASFYGYVTDGIFQNSAEVAAHATQNGASAGDIRFVDLDGNGIIDVNDQTFIGNPTPNFSYGLNASAAYKGFDMSIFLQGSQGNDIYNATVRYDFVFANRPNSVLDRWTGEGTSADEPRVSISDPNQNARVSDRFIEDGSYLRVKNLQIGYTIPSSITQKVKLRQVRLYVAAQNLFTFTKYSGLDPEIGTRGSLEIGIDRGFYPQARTYMAGLNIKL